MVRERKGKGEKRERKKKQRKDVIGLSGPNGRDGTKNTDKKKERRQMKLRNKAWLMMDEGDETGRREDEMNVGNKGRWQREEDSLSRCELSDEVWGDC